MNKIYFFIFLFFHKNYLDKHLLVGYGDIYPRTLLGRIVIFFCSIYGVTVVSLMVVAITNTLEMSNAENKSYLTLERLEIKTQMKEKASKMVSHVGKLGSVSKMSKKQKIELVQNMAKATTGFKNLRR